MFILYTTLNILYFDTKNIIKWVIFGELVSFRSAKITATHFVWNQDEAAQNSRYADKYYYNRRSAQTLRRLAVRVKPISYAL